jgi:hypothetical protein
MASIYDRYPQLRDSWDTEANGNMALWMHPASTQVRWLCDKVKCHR